MTSWPIEAALRQLAKAAQGGDRGRAALWAGMARRNGATNPEVRGALQPTSEPQR